MITTILTGFAIYLLLSAVLGTVLAFLVAPVCRRARLEQTTPVVAPTDRM